MSEINRRCFAKQALLGAATLATGLPFDVNAQPALKVEGRDVKEYCEVFTGLIHALTELPRAVVKIPRELGRELKAYLSVLRPKNFVHREDNNAKFESARLLGRSQPDPKPSVIVPAAALPAKELQDFHDQFSELFVLNAAMVLDLKPIPTARVPSYSVQYRLDAELATPVDLNAPAYQYNAAEMGGILNGIRVEPVKQWIAVDLRQRVEPARVVDTLKSIVDADLVDQLLKVYEPAYQRPLVPGVEVFGARFAPRPKEGDRGYGFVNKANRNKRAFVLTAHNALLTTRTIEAVLQAG